MERYVMGCNHWILNVTSKWVFVALLFTLFSLPLTPLFAQESPPVEVTDPRTRIIPGPGSPGFQIPDRTGTPSQDTPATERTDPRTDIQAGPGSPGFVPPEIEAKETAAGGGATQTLVPTGTVDSWIYKVVITVSGWILQAGGYLFDTGFKMFVMDLGCWYVKGCQSDQTGGGQIGEVVNEVWEIIRDFFNILFIFTLIYIGIRTILFTENTGTRKLLGGLIAAALLINFSLYIAKVVVDISNFTAVQIAENIVVTQDFRLAPNIVEKGGEQVDYAPTIELDGQTIAGSFMHVLKFSSFFSTKASPSQFILYSLMLLFFSVILALTFAYAGFMLLGRFIAITFYLIFSPLMFLGLILPEFKSMGSKWWKGFVGYCLYAPVFIFLMYVTLFTLASMEKAFVGEYGSAFSGEYSTSMFSIFVFFAIGIGFIITSTKLADAIAKQTGAIGISTASKWGKKATFGAAAWTGGRTATSAFGGFGKGVENFSNRVPSVLGGSHVRSWGENLQKKNIGGSSSYKERKDATEEHNKKRGNAVTERKLKDAVSAGTASGAQGDDFIKLERGVANASASQLEKLGAKKLANNKVAGALSASQFDTLMKSDKFSDSEKGKIADARKKAVETKLYDNQNNRTKIEDASLAQLEALGSEYIVDKAGDLTPGQLDELKKKMTESEFDRIKGANKTALVQKLNSNNPDTAFKKPDGSWKKDKDIAQMPADVLKHRNSVYYMNANILRNILDKETLNANDRADLKQNIRGAAWGQFSPAEQAAMTNFFASPLGSNF